MIKMKSVRLSVLLSFFLVGACFLPLTNAIAGKHHCDPAILSKAPLENVQAQLDKLTPISIAPDYSYLPQRDQKAIHFLIKATKLTQRLFMKQVHPCNYRFLKELESYIGTPEQAYYDFFKIMLGPWDRLNGNAPFLNLDNTRPAGVNYYPHDLTQNEFETWIADHPEDEDTFTSPFTVIKRIDDGLKAVPYSTEHGLKLGLLAHYLRKAAKLTTDESLAKYLESRAEAFFSNNYRQSDIDWIGLSGDIELVIGPYETYEDELMGYKAAFESYVCLVDHEESEKLEAIESYREELLKNYPLPDGMEINPKGLASPIKVVNELYAGGDARVGIPAIAFNLPNDEWVRENVGSKNVMLKNLLEAKFNGILVPIKDTLLVEEESSKPTFEAFFNFVLMHEISHGLGPGEIVVNGVETTVKEQLKELYSTIEECQADTLSVYNLQYMIDAPHIEMPEGFQDALYASYLAGMFRSIRFGIDSAHGGGIAIELNWHLENGGFKINQDGLFYLDVDKLKESIRTLASKLLVIELTGDYNGALELTKVYRVVTPQIQAAIDKLMEVPTDIKKIYPFDDDQQPLG